MAPGLVEDLPLSPTEASNGGKRANATADPSTMKKGKYNAIPGPLGLQSASLEGKVALVTGAGKSCHHSASLSLSSDMRLFWRTEPFSCQCCTWTCIIPVLYLLGTWYRRPGTHAPAVRTPGGGSPLAFFSHTPPQLTPGRPPHGSPSLVCSRDYLVKLTSS